MPQEHSCRLPDYKPWKQRPFLGSVLYRLGCLDVQHPINPPEGIRNPEDVTASLELAQQRRDPQPQQQGVAHHVHQLLLRDPTLLAGRAQPRFPWRR